MVVFSAFTMLTEQNGNPNLTTAGADQSISTTQSGGNMEGKEVRFGAAGCGLFASSTTGTSTGAVNCMHDSFTPLGGMAPMLHIMLGEISPGGTGVGLVGILIMALLAVFIAGLMVGRTPEYLGKKIQAAEMKLLTLYILAMPFALKPFAAASAVLKSANTHQAGPHGLSEILYNFASTANNNGSAFAYQGTGTLWYTTTQGISMLMGRFLTDHPCAGDRWRAGPQAEGAGDRWNDADAHPAVRLPRGRRHHHHRRPDVLPSARPGTDSRAPLTVTDF